MAPSMMESIVMRKCEVSRKKAKEITETARENMQLKINMMWSKEWEEECLKIYLAEDEKLSVKKNAEQAAYNIDIKPTLYVPGRKTFICGVPVAKEADLCAKPNVVQPKTENTATPDIEPEQSSPRCNLKRRQTIGRTTARRRSLSLGRAALRSRSRGRSRSKSKERTINDEEKPRLMRNKSGSKKKKKIGTKTADIKNKVSEPKHVPVETPLMRRHSRSRTRKLLYESGSEDENVAQWSDDALSEDESLLCEELLLSGSFARLEWSDDAMSDDEEFAPSTRHKRFPHRKQTAPTDCNYGSSSEYASTSPSHNESRMSLIDDRKNCRIEPTNHTKMSAQRGRSHSRKRQTSSTEKEQVARVDKRDNERMTNSSLRKRSPPSRNRQISTASKGRDEMDACASETESPSCKNRSVSRTKPSSTPEKRDKVTCDEPSWEQHESPIHRHRSISRTRQSSLTEKGIHIIGDGSPSDPSAQGRRSRSRTRHSNLKEKDNPQRNTLSSSRQQQNSCQSKDELQSSRHKATRKSKVMPKESDPKTRMRSTTTFDRSGKSREIDGCHEAIHVVLFDEDSEYNTCNDSAPSTPSSKRSNVLTQHLQNLEATPGSAKTTPGRSKQQIEMVRSSSIGRRRGTSNDGSDCERGPVKRGNLKTPSSGAKTPRQSSILRRNSTKFQGDGPHCPDLNSSKACYL